MQNEEGVKVDLYIPRKWYVARVIVMFVLVHPPPKMVFIESALILMMRLLRFRGTTLYCLEIISLLYIR